MELLLKFNLGMVALLGACAATLMAWGPALTLPVAAALVLLGCAGINLLLGGLVIAPLRRLLASAERISTGQSIEPDLPEHGADEFSRIGRCFNRMRHSLDKAMHALGPASGF